MQCDTPCDAGPLQQAPAPSQPHGHKGKQLSHLYSHTTILFVTLGTKMLLKAVHPLLGGKEEVKHLLTQFFFFFLFCGQSWLRRAYQTLPRALGS